MDGDTMLFSGEASAFYAPMITDDGRAGAVFAGMEHVWRTNDNGGDQAFLEAHCNTTFLFGTSDLVFTGDCGDDEPTGDPLNGGLRRRQGAGSGVELGRDRVRPRTRARWWAATRRGRVFVSKNVNARHPGT